MWVFDPCVPTENYQARDGNAKDQIFNNRKKLNSKVTPLTISRTSLWLFQSNLTREVTTSYLKCKLHEVSFSPYDAEQWRLNSLMTITVNEPTANPRMCHVVAVPPAATRRYSANTARGLAKRVEYKSKIVISPMALLLLKESRTDCTAKAVGRRNFGFG